MTSITVYLGSDHKRCDELFASAETHVCNGRWGEAEADLTAFGTALERHFTMEESVLFPAFEEATGNSHGPTYVMRMEHQQMRSMLVMLRESLDARDADNFFGCSETFNTMMQQHNLKEESILYVMTDQVLSGRQDEIISAMSGIETAA